MAVKLRRFREIAEDFAKIKSWPGVPPEKLKRDQKYFFELADSSDETHAYMASDERTRIILTHKKAAQVLAQWHAAGYDTYDKFCNAVLAVYPELDYADLWCYFDFLQPDWFIGLKAEKALRILQPTL